MNNLLRCFKKLQSSEISHLVEVYFFLYPITEGIQKYFEAQILLVSFIISATFITQRQFAAWIIEWYVDTIFFIYKEILASLTD